MYFTNKIKKSKWINILHVTFQAKINEKKNQKKVLFSFLFHLNPIHPDSIKVCRFWENTNNEHVWKSPWRISHKGLSLPPPYAMSTCPAVHTAASWWVTSWCSKTGSYMVSTMVNRYSYFSKVSSEQWSTPQVIPTVSRGWQDQRRMGRKLRFGELLS